MINSFISLLDGV